MKHMRRMRSTLAAALLALVVAVRRRARPHRRSRTAPRADCPAAPPEGDQPITAGQIQRWFEAFTVLQAQDRLQLSEAQYGKFVTRLKALQETRRTHQQAHQRILNDLRRLTNPDTGSNDEAAITERLKALSDEEDAAAGADISKAYDGVDETLDLRQQARFRIFEDQMEQQKLELLMRARQNARAEARGREAVTPRYDRLTVNCSCVSLDRPRLRRRFLRRRAARRTSHSRRTQADRFQAKLVEIEKTASHSGETGRAGGAA